MDGDFEKTLFLGLCKLFTREKVLSLYKTILTDQVLTENVVDVPYEDNDGEQSYPSIFVNFNKEIASQIVSLLRKLLELFNIDELRNGKMTYQRGEEPHHIIFLYLIQLLAIFMSTSIEDQHLAVIMSVASAVFLEANFRNPLCAATILRPMFIPYYTEQVSAKNQVGDTEEECPEARLRYYKLFTGYELDKDGTDISENNMDLQWTDVSILERMQGFKIVEGESKKLWFVSPQMGDRMLMVNNGAFPMMGEQTGVKPIRLCHYLMSDNVMAYIQCAVFGTISNMLPCHANSDFSEDVMSTLNHSMAKLSNAIRHQSANLMMKMNTLKKTCLVTNGVGFNGQDKGKTLQFGNVFTGTEDKRPPQVAGRNGVFTSMILGLSSDTMMKAMLTIALHEDSTMASGDNLHKMLSTTYKPVGVYQRVNDIHFYGRYHNTFNKGEFTEVACVKSMKDPNYSSQVHSEMLSDSSKYQLTVAHGALPMCTLTLAMTMRQTVMMVMGYFCTELARVIYTPKETDVNLCRQLPVLSMPAKFVHGKDDDSTNTFDATYGMSLKLTGTVFNKNSSMTGSNHSDLDGMEWLQSTDKHLPEYIRMSLQMIGDTKKEAAKIMTDQNMRYNRVAFQLEGRMFTFASMFANAEFMLHAPMMALSNMMIFSGKSNNNYATVKFSKHGCYYTVRVFNNDCIDTSLYSQSEDVNRPTAEKTMIDDMVDRIKKGVSCVLPRIAVSRIKMMAPDLNETDFRLLLLKLKNDNIKVTGEEEYLSSASSSVASETSSRLSTDHRDDRKRTTDDVTGSPETKKLNVEDQLTIFDSYFESD